MHKELTDLVELQKLSDQYRQLLDITEELPRQIAACEAEHESVSKRHDEVLARLKQAQVDLHNAEVDLKAGEESLQKKQQRLNEAKTNEEYKAGLKEIESQKNRNSEAETRILEAMDKVEETAKEEKESKRVLEEERNEYDQKLQGLKDRLTEASAELDKYADLIEKKRSEMNPRTIQRFNRISSRNAGTAVAPTNNHFCGYCQVHLADHRIQAAQEGRDLIICDHCGTILYWDAEQAARDLEEKQRLEEEKKKSKRKKKKVPKEEAV